jgi:hypothetical protein
MSPGEPAPNISSTARMPYVYEGEILELTAVVLLINAYRQITIIIGIVSCGADP